MTAALASIRKALIAFVGAAAAGVSGIVTANGGFDSINQAQISTVLFLALTAAVSTFAVPNKYKSTVEAAEKKVADLAAAQISSGLAAWAASWSKDSNPAPVPAPAPAEEPVLAPVPDPEPEAGPDPDSELDPELDDDDDEIFDSADDPDLGDQLSIGPDSTVFPKHAA